MGGAAGASSAAILGEAERRMTISGKTMLAGVIGWPVSHSRSPALHNYWCARHGVDGAYVPLPVAPGALAAALKGLMAAGFRGVNVTIPHKEEAFRLVDALTAAAKRAGAVNTIRFEPDGTMRGDCTDGTGFVANLEAHDCAMSGQALVLGAGGAARAVIAALLDAGCDVLIANRTRDRAESLVAALGGGTVIDWDRWPDALARCTLLVNATSLGLAGHQDHDWTAPLREAPAGMTVADIVYVPLETPLLRAAKARGLKTVDGLGMLIQQARAGFAAWFGTWPDADAETRVLLLRGLNEGGQG